MTARTTASRFGTGGRVAVALTLLVALGGALAPAVAGAAVGTKVSAADCDALGEIGDNIDEAGGGSNPAVFGKQAQALADGLDETAGDIKNKKLRKSLRAMADFYDELGDADNLVAAGRVAVSEGRAYAKAIKVFTKITLKCVTSQITLPSDVTLPSGVTLPGNLTLPSIPR